MRLYALLCAVAIMVGICILIIKNASIIIDIHLNLLKIAYHLVAYI